MPSSPETNTATAMTTTFTQDCAVQKNAKKLDHILIALDGSPNCDAAFQWAKQKFIHPDRHVIYLLTVARVDPQSSMIYSAGLGQSFAHTHIQPSHS
jgi:Universal stress protein family